MEILAWVAEHLGISSAAAVPLLVGMLLMWGFIRVVQGGGDKNPVEFWHFFASYNTTVGAERGDVNSLGMVAGIVVCLTIPPWIVFKNPTGDINFMVLAVCLIYLGGVKAFSLWLRTVAAKRYSLPADPPEPPALPPVQHELTKTTTDKTITQGPAQ